MLYEALFSKIAVSDNVVFCVVNLSRTERDQSFDEIQGVGTVVEISKSKIYSLNKALLP